MITQSSVLNSNFAATSRSTWGCQFLSLMGVTEVYLKLLLIFLLLAYYSTFLSLLSYLPLVYPLFSFQNFIVIISSFTVFLLFIYKYSTYREQRFKMLLSSR